MKKGYVYIMTNIYHTTLYIGVTSDLKNRVLQHKEKMGSKFTRKYSLTKLVYYEEFESIIAAINREKQLKNWRRSWKEELILGHNPNWIDLYYEFIRNIISMLNLRMSAYIEPLKTSK